MNDVEKILFDTNVLVYAHDRSETVKGPLAKGLLTQIFACGKPLVSIQVLSEFFWAVTRKIPIPLTNDEAIAEINRLQILSSLIVVTWDVLDRALQFVVNHSLALWDAQILAAANLHGAKFILSEDFQHRQTLETVTFLNPFAPDFDLTELIATP
ncbi:MAG TPA: PIN domain-containing protein [Gemmataceae bacterium]|jgi:predicted nucleic acid-binding protein|nr:PIN domain-containing protein [Gemmataceae bacterium]